MQRWLLASAFVFSALARGEGIPAADDLGADAERARATGVPVVVLFTASYCEFCTAVKSGYFRHLEDDPRYASRIILREVVIDSGENLTDFDGTALTHGRFADANDVFLVPTVRFFDGTGEQLAEPLVGVSNMDFYGWYLDARLNIAMKRARPAPVAARNPG